MYARQPLYPLSYQLIYILMASLWLLFRGSAVGGSEWSRETLDRTRMQWWVESEECLKGCDPTPCALGEDLRGQKRRPLSPPQNRWLNGT